MSRLFTYSSQITFLLHEESHLLIPKFVLELRKKLTAYSGEDNNLKNNTINFAVTPKGYGIQFFGIDSGEVNIDHKDGKLLVKYRLSYLSPFVPFLILDIFLIWLSSLIPSRFELSAFVALITGFLGLYVLGIILAILLFPSIIRDVWNSVSRK